MSYPVLLPMAIVRNMLTRKVNTLDGRPMYCECTHNIPGPLWQRDNQLGNPFYASLSLPDITPSSNASDDKCRNAKWRSLRDIFPRQCIVFQLEYRLTATVERKVASKVTDHNLMFHRAI